MLINEEISERFVVFGCSCYAIRCSKISGGSVAGGERAHGGSCPWKVGSDGDGRFGVSWICNDGHRGCSVVQPVKGGSMMRRRFGWEKGNLLSMLFYFNFCGRENICWVGSV